MTNRGNCASNVELHITCHTPVLKLSLCTARTRQCLLSQSSLRQRSSLCALLRTKPSLCNQSLLASTRTLPISRLDLRLQVVQPARHVVHFALASARTFTYLHIQAGQVELTFGQQIAADGREFGVELVQQVVHYGGELGRAVGACAEAWRLLYLSFVWGVDEDVLTSGSLDEDGGGGDDIVRKLVSMQCRLMCAKLLFVTTQYWW